MMTLRSLEMSCILSLFVPSMKVTLLEAQGRWPIGADAYIAKPWASSQNPFNPVLDLSKGVIRNRNKGEEVSIVLQIRLFIPC